MTLSPWNDEFGLKRIALEALQTSTGLWFLIGAGSLWLILHTIVVLVALAIGIAGFALFSRREPQAAKAPRPAANLQPVH